MKISINRIQKLAHILHRILLFLHIAMAVFEGFEKNLFGFGLWLTLGVNVVLLLDLEKLTERLNLKLMDTRGEKIESHFTERQQKKECMN